MRVSTSLVGSALLPEAEAQPAMEQHANATSSNDAATRARQLEERRMAEESRVNNKKRSQDLDLLVPL